MSQVLNFQFDMRKFDSGESIIQIYNSHLKYVRSCQLHEQFLSFFLTNFTDIFDSSLALAPKTTTRTFPTHVNKLIRSSKIVLYYVRCY